MLTFFFVRTARLEKLLIKREQAVFFPLDLCNTQVNREGVASCLLMFAIDFWNYYLRQSKRLIKATDRCPAPFAPKALLTLFYLQISSSEWLPGQHFHFCPSDSHLLSIGELCETLKWSSRALVFLLRNMHILTLKRNICLLSTK